MGHFTEIPTLTKLLKKKKELGMNVSEWHVAFIGSASANSILVNFRQRHNNPLEFYRYSGRELKCLVMKPNSGSERCLCVQGGGEG